MTAHASALATLEARVAEQPWRTLGGVFLLGAWVGYQQPRAPRNPLTRAALAMIGSLVLRMARDLALRELVNRATGPAPER
jgi:hypothetical protein